MIFSTLSVGSKEDTKPLEDPRPRKGRGVGELRKAAQRVSERTDKDARRPPD